jgi:hypothetical protein
MGEGLMNDAPLQEIATNEVLRKRLAKLMALRCFRNTVLAEFHSGTVPGSRAGDFSDVRVVSPYGEIPWKRLSRLSDDEMKVLMIDVVNHCYAFLSDLFKSTEGRAIVESLKQRDPVVGWYDPE